MSEVTDSIPIERNCHQHWFFLANLEDGRTRVSLEDVTKMPLSTKMSAEKHFLKWASQAKSVKRKFNKRKRVINQKDTGNNVKVSKSLNLFDVWVRIRVRVIQYLLDEYLTLKNLTFMVRPLD
ncbi:hypothetical protein ACTXT7_013594 [Hymenolepis weldensis]